MKKSELKTIVKECYNELLKEIAVYKPTHFKVTIENTKSIQKDGKTIFTEWTGFGRIFLPFVGWKSLNRGTRKPKFVWGVGKKLYEVDISKYLEQQENKKKISETVDNIIYTNEIVDSSPSIEMLIGLYSSDYIDFVKPGSARFFDYGNTFKFSFILIFPRKQVEFKTFNECYQVVAKSLNFYHSEKDGGVYGKGEIKPVTEDELFFILNFTVRGGKL